MCKDLNNCWMNVSSTFSSCLIEPISSSFLSCSIMFLKQSKILFSNHNVGRVGSPLDIMLLATNNVCSNSELSNCELLLFTSISKYDSCFKSPWTSEVLYSVSNVSFTQSSTKPACSCFFIVLIQQYG